MFSYGPRHMAEQKQGSQLEPTCSSSVRIRDVALRTSQKQWMIGGVARKGQGYPCWWCDMMMMMMTFVGFLLVSCFHYHLFHYKFIAVLLIAVVVIPTEVIIVVTGFVVVVFTFIRSRSRKFSRDDSTSFCCLNPNGTCSIGTGNAFLWPCHWFFFFLFFLNSAYHFTECGGRRPAGWSFVITWQFR